MKKNVSITESIDWLVAERAKYNPLDNREFWIIDNAIYALEKEKKYENSN